LRGRSGYPIGRSKLTKANFVKLRYVHAGTSAPGHQMIEQWLAEADIKRQIAIRLGHFTVASEIVRDTGLAVIFPEGLGRQFNSAKVFRSLTLLFDLPPAEMKVHTHPRFASDKDISWLRDTLAAMFAQRG
jgi:DNA-binding transcriptional LysR family regulator